MASLAQRVETVEGRLDGLDRLETLVTRLVEEGAREREEAERRRAVEREKMARQRQEAERQEAIEREKMARDQEKFERYLADAARERREVNRKWGEASDRIGRFVEDVVAPSVRRMAREVFDCGDEIFFAAPFTRARGGDRSRMREFDALYVGEHRVLLNETKSTPRHAALRHFAKFVRDGELDHYFPEYRAMPVVPVFSSLRIPDDMVHYLTRQGIYALAVGDEIMDVLNLDAVRRRQRRASPRQSPS